MRRGVRLAFLVLSLAMLGCGSPSDVDDAGAMDGSSVFDASLRDGSEGGAQAASPNVRDVPAANQSWQPLAVQ